MSGQGSAYTYYVRNLIMLEYGETTLVSAVRVVLLTKCFWSDLVWFVPFAVPFFVSGHVQNSSGDFFFPA